jgi:chromate transport protein ChrA
VYTYVDLPLDKKVTLVQYLHVLASGAVVVLLAGFYWRFGRRYDYRYLAIIGLKLYLAIFYFFVQIPYSYLIALSVLLSVFVLLIVIRPTEAAPSPSVSHT